MKRNLLKILLCLPLLGVISCQADFAQDFDLSLANTSPVLINTTTRSCTLQIGDPGHQSSDDVQALYLTLGSFKINWKGKNPLRLAYLEISVASPNIANGKQVIDIASSELAYIWSGSLSLGDIAPNGGEIESSAHCNFVVGGIKLNDLSKSTFGQGTLLVYGTTDSDNGTVDASATANFTFTYHAPNGQ